MQWRKGNGEEGVRGATAAHPANGHLTCTWTCPWESTEKQRQKKKIPQLDGSEMYGVGTSQNTSIHLSCLKSMFKDTVFECETGYQLVMLSSSNIQTHIHDLHYDNCENPNPELLATIMNYHDLFLSASVEHLLCKFFFELCLSGQIH